MMAFLDDGPESFGFLGKVGCLVLLDADGIVGEQLFLRGLEFTFVAKLRETGCDLLCGHLLLLRAKAHGKVLFGQLGQLASAQEIMLLEGFEREARAEFQPSICRWQPTPFTSAEGASQQMPRRRSRWSGRSARIPRLEERVNPSDPVMRCCGREDGIGVAEAPVTTATASRAPP